MRGVFGLAALVLASAVLCAAPARAQDNECSFGGSRTSDSIVAACTQIIDAAGADRSGLAETYYVRGEAYFALQRFPDAAADYTEALNLNHPRAAHVLAARADAYLRQQDFARADADLDRAEALGTSEPIVPNLRANLLFAEGDLIGALAAYERALALNPNGYELRFMRALIFARQGAPEQAAAEIDAILQMQGVTAEALASEANGRCWDFGLQNRELDYARALCEASLRARPNDGNTLDSLGLISFRQGRYQQAWNEYSAAIAVGGEGSSSSWYMRGVVGLRMGQVSQGQSDIARARSLNSEIGTFYERWNIRP